MLDDLSSLPEARARFEREAQAIAVQTLGAGQQKVLVQGGGYGRVFALDDRRGYLVYARPEGLLAAPMDLQAMALAGSALPVLDGVITNLSGGAHFWKSADGSDSGERLASGRHPRLPSSVSPDGRTLAFIEYSPDSAADIWLLPLSGDRRPRAFLQTPFSEGNAMISPDGRWLAYQSNESGRFEVYVAPFPDGGAKFQVLKAKVAVR